MGNCWKGISDARFEEYESKMLQHSGLRVPEDFQISNVIIDDQGNYIRTIEVGDRAKQTMVILHGFGASGVIFWKIMKPLVERYHLIFVDILGMGGSSRPEFTPKNPIEADEYLVAWLEAWRLKVRPLEPQGLTGFILAGHSFGGYVCGLYAIKYSQHIKKLLMLSPAGVTTIPQDFDIYPEIEHRLKQQGRKVPSRCCFNCCFGCVGKLWGCKCSPFAIMRCCGGCCVNRLMKNYVKNRFASVPEEELVDFKVYLHQTLLRKGSTEYAIFICFNHFLFAYNPLDSDTRLGGVKIPVSFFYGDRDWMYTPGGDTIVNKNPHKGTKSHVYIISNSDHHLYFDNPQEFADTILKDLDNLDTPIDQITKFGDNEAIPQLMQSKINSV